MRRKNWLIPSIAAIAAGFLAVPGQAAPAGGMMGDLTIAAAGDSAGVRQVHGYYYRHYRPYRYYRSYRPRYYHSYRYHRPYGYYGYRPGFYFSFGPRRYYRHHRRSPY